MFSCPNCAQVLGEYPDRGTLVVACARCTFKYEANGGVAMAMHSQKVELTPASARARAVHIRRFELVVATSIRETVRFTFETDRTDNWIGIARRWLRPTNALAADERDTLSARQALLGQKRELLRSRDIVLVEIEGRRALRQRLESLRDRMVALRLDDYAERIVAIECALATLGEQLQLDVRLAEEYDRAIQILDIEYESSLAAEAIPSDGTSIVAARLLELRDIEELRAETTRRLAANAEVERLLRTPTP